MDHLISPASLKPSLLDLSFPELARVITDLGQPAFRARQVWEWVYRHGASDFTTMTNLPQRLRDELDARYTLSLLEPIDEQVSQDGRTIKVLFRLLRPTSGRRTAAMNTLESVLMLYDPRDDPQHPSRARRTVCVSTQAGCPIGCPFCATGLSGFERNLTVGEIVEQALWFERLSRTGHITVPSNRPGDRLLTNVVFMGMGEPFANFDATWRAIETLHSREGYDLGARNMTVSTSGLIPGIERLASSPLQIGLAVSLHAPTDQLRDYLVPINRRYPLAVLLEACRAYVRKTGRRITFEYALMDGVNDSVAQARQTAALLEGLLCHVNLIPLNPTGVETLRRSPLDRVLAFQRELQRAGIETTVRVEKGVEIQAACGQLRLRAAQAAANAVIAG